MASPALRTDVTPAAMIRWREAFNGIRISVGYTDENNDKGEGETYSPAMVKEMVDTVVKVSGVNENGNQAAIDINLRGKRIVDKRNRKAVKKLLASVPKKIQKDLSITVWNWAKYGDTASDADKRYFKSLLPGNSKNVLLDL